MIRTAATFTVALWLLPVIITASSGLMVFSLLNGGRR